MEMVILLKDVRSSAKQLNKELNSFITRRLIFFSFFLFSSALLYHFKINNYFKPHNEKSLSVLRLIMGAYPGTFVERHPATTQSTVSVDRRLSGP